MNDIEQKKAAKEFAAYWKGKGRERQDDRSYWTQLLEGVFGVQDATKYYEAAKPVTVLELDGKKHDREIDIYIPSAKVLIEQKGVNIDLSKKAHQSGGDMLTPFEQAKRYNDWLGKDAARWIICCNFAEFWIYDMYTPTEPPIIIKLEDLPEKYHLMNFLLDANVKKLIVEQELSFKAGELVGKLYNLMLPQYKDPTAESTLQALNKFCVRIVFCLYAEDALLFGAKGSEFHDYLASFLPENRRKALISLFRILDQPEAERDPYEDKKLLDFPHVNGGLFAGDIEIPHLTDEITQLILEDMSEKLDWSHISPTIFGAVFESTLNPDTRRKGGMHYTSIKDIHKVIDPLFLDDLKNDFYKIVSDQKLSKPKRKAALENFHNRLSQVHFLDPACGSGNFLTETFLSLRRLENEVIEQLQRGLMVLEFANPVKVSIGQFAGIEINDFAVTVARTALWIAESQMIKETEAIVNQTIEFFPLKTDAKIIEGNALRMDWNDVISKYALTYIMGNPPFVGASKMTAEQKKEAVEVFGKIQRANSIDYVGAWFHKAADYIQGTPIRCAFVATNSITQGEMVFPLWNKMLNEYHIHIDFAYRSFKWINEATEQAGVTVVIIGFSQAIYTKQKHIFSNKNEIINASNITPYLVDSPITTLIKAKSRPFGNVPAITLGNKPSDGGNLILSEDDKKEILQKDASVSDLILKYVGSDDFINHRKPRYCLWLKDVSPSRYSNNKFIINRLLAVKDFRSKSTAKPTKLLAETPYRFFFAPQNKWEILCIPETSSENRRYIPIGFLKPKEIASNSLLIIPEGNYYHFGILTSNVHMAWMRAVGGRLESRYRYSSALVYNTFPWPNCSEEQRQKIELTAKEILNVRAKYPDTDLAHLYENDMLLYPDLKKAHQANDRAVMEAYGMWGNVHSESECVAWLFRMYENLTKNK